MSNEYTTITPRLDKAVYNCHTDVIVIIPYCNNIIVILNNFFSVIYADLAFSYTDSLCMWDLPYMYGVLFIFSILCVCDRLFFFAPSETSLLCMYVIRLDGRTSYNTEFYFYP